LKHNERKKRPFLLIF